MLHGGSCSTAVLSYAFAIVLASNADTELCCRASTVPHIVKTTVLEWGWEADQLCVQALVAALPIRLKVLDAAGSSPYVQTTEPPSASSNADGASGSLENSSDHLAEPTGDVLQVWLIFEPSHYEVLRPAEAYKHIQHLKEAGVYFER